MPPFPERESSLLAKLRKTAPKAAKIHEKALPPIDTVQEAPTTSPAQEPLPATINEVNYIHIGYNIIYKGRTNIYYCMYVYLYCFTFTAS